MPGVPTPQPISPLQVFSSLTGPVPCLLQAIVPGLPGPTKGTALHMACVNFCCPDTMQLLLEHGADIHAQLRSPDRTLDKATPLLLTVRLGAHLLLGSPAAVPACCWDRLLLCPPAAVLTCCCAHLLLGPPAAVLTCCQVQEQCIGEAG
jgi:hypothetical protein